MSPNILDSPTQQDRPKLQEKAIRDIISARQYSDVKRSSWQLINSLVPFVGLWFLAHWSLEISYWLTLAICTLAGGFLVRLFIISHDCGHGSFFRSKHANAFWGSICSTLAFVPYYAWKYEHAVHHANSGNLDKRGTGDIKTMTVVEYQQASKLVRFKYRLYRHPFMMLFVGPVWIFVIGYRFWRKEANQRVRTSIIRTNIALAVIIPAMGFLVGFKELLLIQLPITIISGAAGIYMFYVQHQFEGVYWERDEKWDFFTAALLGSSYFKLPIIFQWFTGNIGFHDIHHLGSKIPNYFLEKSQVELSKVHQFNPMSVRTSFKCLSYRLWDEERRELVGFARAEENPSATS